MNKMLRTVSAAADDIFPCGGCEFDNDSRTCFDCFCLYCGNFDFRSTASYLSSSSAKADSLSECASCATNGITFGLTRVHVQCHAMASSGNQVDVVCNVCHATLLARAPAPSGGNSEEKLSSPGGQQEDSQSFPRQVNKTTKTYSVPNYLRALMCSDPRLPFEVLHCGSLRIGLQALAAAKQEEAKDELLSTSPPHETQAAPCDEEVTLDSLHSKPFYPMEVIKQLTVENSPVDNQLRFCHNSFRPYRSTRRSELWRTEGTEVVADGSIEGAALFIKKTREDVDDNDEDFVKGLVRPHVLELMEKYGLRVKRKWEIISKKKREEREYQERVATKRKRSQAKEEVSTMYLFPTPALNARRHRIRDKGKNVVYDDTPVEADDTDDSS